MVECRGTSVPSCADPRACINDSMNECLNVGEHLYPHVQSLEPMLACKITGMLLEMAESEIMALLENQLACRDKLHT